jgi:hypothetical protein
MMSSHKQKVDDKRKGWWISLDEAQSRSVGNEKWWAKQDRSGWTVPVKQYEEGPNSKPVWFFKNGDMYLGEWKDNRENGLGVTYNSFPIKKKGLIYMGEWKEGEPHGAGWIFILVGILSGMEN